MNHQHHHLNQPNKSKEYIKFFAVLVGISISSLLVWLISSLQFLDAFMGMFFLVFAGFKLSNLKVFAYGFQSYDIVAAKSIMYAYMYPFIQLAFAVVYLAGFGSSLSDVLVIIISLVSAIGVLRTLGAGAKVHCVCLGNIIKLPLSRITFVEDFGMAIMAAAMLIMR